MTVVVFLGVTVIKLLLRLMVVAPTLLRNSGKNPLKFYKKW